MWRSITMLGDGMDVDREDAQAVRGAADDDAQRKLFVSTLKRWVDDAGVGKVTELDHVDALEPRYNLGGRRALPRPASCGRRCRRAPPRQSPKGWPSPDLRQAARTTPCASLMRPTSPASDQDAYDRLFYLRMWFMVIIGCLPFCLRRVSSENVLAS